MEMMTSFALPLRSSAFQISLSEICGCILPIISSYDTVNAFEELVPAPVIDISDDR